MACEFMRNYADYLSNKGHYQRSNNIYHQIAKMMPEVADLSAIQMAMAGNYINLHKIDSARICNEKAIKSEAKLEAKGFSDIARRAVIELERCILDFENGKHISYVDFPDIVILLQPICKQKKILWQEDKKLKSVCNGAIMN